MTIPESYSKCPICNKALPQKIDPFAEMRDQNPADRCMHLFHASCLRSFMINGGRNCPSSLCGRVIRGFPPSGILRRTDFFRDSIESHKFFGNSKG